MKIEFDDPIYYILLGTTKGGKHKIQANVSLMNKGECLSRGRGTAIDFEKTQAIRLARKRALVDAISKLPKTKNEWFKET